METNILDKNLKKVEIGDTIFCNKQLYVVKYGNFKSDGIDRIGFYAETLSIDKKQLALTGLRDFNVFKI
jgi:hypothetical protein